MNERIALVRIPGGVSKAIRTFPGQVLKVVGGVGEVKHEMHMPSVLKLGPEVVVELDAGWADFLGNWLAKIGGADAVTCDLRINGQEVTAEAPSEEPIGRHKAGCPCGLCNRVRERRRALAAA